MVEHETTIAPGIGAYYHLPAQWIGSEPTETEFEHAPVAELIRDEHRTTLNHNIRVRVRRDGLFVFDCSHWEPGGTTEIPAYTVAAGGIIPRQVSEADRMAELRASTRTVLMNAHQACLSSAHGRIHQRAAGLGTIVVPSRAIRLLDFDHNDVIGLNTNDPYERHLSLLLAFTRGYRVKELRSRRIIELDTVDYSFQLLDQLLRSPIGEHLQIVELLFRAGVQYFEWRFAESLILSWTVCERLLDVLWTTYLEANGSDNTGQTRINRPRREKLIGREFTASVELEILELANRLPFSLFKKLNDIRRTRNAWLHSLKEVSAEDASSAVRSTEELMKYVTGFDISLCLSRHGGHISIPKRFYGPNHSLNWEALQDEMQSLREIR